MSFKFNNGRMYCSELVYVIYKEQFGIEKSKFLLYFWFRMVTKKEEY